LAGIYIHIPYCRQACHYCDFHFSTNISKKSKLVDSICKELVLQRDYLSQESVETIYFGGGSPSLLTTSELTAILTTVRQNFSIISNAEITLEGNPDDLTFSYLKSIYDLGINRLSIGVQSFNEQSLRFLNRVHNARQSAECLENAVKAGFDNFNIDLIYGIQSNDHSSWKNDLEMAMAIRPRHISAYCLTIEEKTAFGNWLKKGKMQPVNEEFAAEQFEMLVEKLEHNNYEHYEISNFALPSAYSKHNSSYWKGKNYLGVGPGAHSFNGSSRRFNIENNEKYINFLNENRVLFEEEVLTLENKINEYILTTLRTVWGCDNEHLMKNFNFDLIKDKSFVLEDLLKGEYLMQKNQTLFLTKRGKLMADKITEQLWVEI